MRTHLKTLERHTESAANCVPLRNKMKVNGTKVIIVDDDEDLLSLMAAALRHDGYDVRCAQDVAEAILLIREDKPRLIVVDLKMPAVPGEELCRIIKEDPAWNDIIVFVLSAEAKLETKLRCLQIGVEEFLVKPIHSLELSARISHFIQIWDRMSPSEKPDPFASTRVEQDIAPVPAPSVAEQNKLQKSFGIYHVEMLVGSGGMGSVYKAHDRMLERAVAIKVLAPQFSGSQEFVARFHREAKVLAALEHPNIAAIYNFGEESGRQYFAMQWCAGGSLAQLLSQRKSLNPLLATEVTLQCSKALWAASKKGVVHRDIKPSNLMFDENQQVKIVDFGLATFHKISEEITQTGQFMGSPGYVAPEQIQTSDVDFRADMYSLGITFYRMLLGKLPYLADAAVHLLLKHVHEPLPKFEDLPSNQVPEQAYKIIERMTKKNPDHRHQGYEDLIRDLESLQTELLRKAELKFPSARSLSSPRAQRTDSFLNLLTEAGEEKTGIASVRWGSLQKSFLVRQGALILFSSTRESEDVWRALSTKYLWDASEIPDGSLEEQLQYALLSNLLTLEEFQKVYYTMMKAAALEVFLWPVCHAEFIPCDIDHDAFANVPIREVLLEGCRTLVDIEEINRRLPSGMQAQFISGLENELYRISLLPEESFILSRLYEECFTIDRLVTSTGLSRERVFRTVFAFDILKFLKWEQATPRQRQKPADRDFPNAPPQPKTPPPEKKRFFGAEPIRIEAQRAFHNPEKDETLKTAEQYYRSAQANFEKGNYWHAVNFCRQAIQLNPKDARFHVLAGLSFAKHPRFQKDAESAFQRAIELEPQDADYYMFLAEFYLQAGLKYRAIQQCKKALQWSTGHKQALSLLKKLKA